MIIVASVNPMRPDVDRTICPKTSRHLLGVGIGTCGWSVPGAGAANSAVPATTSRSELMVHLAVASRPSASEGAARTGLRGRGTQ